ncbi:rRNA maturation RNase YbeY [Sphingomonas changnyeongensis]|uniref:Endoribonuclease YbeY n=1 Tax=Sphingomonas changnyeongensis TaxID=2698679 RepID=A0A7Z2NWJ6_9SPHN|nr:rRNA maturation RNase YbeY [Sphingomonas changnyeongensis]QHL90559.1 rRNA maturation RNase YbeY [Sphingomonas changnyeongensis]
MIDVAVQVEPDWLAAGDAEAGTESAWEALAERAVRAALAVTPDAGLAAGDTMVEVSVRLAGDAEVHDLNLSYRQKDKPTNVLSFPMLPPDLIAAIASADTNTDDGEVLLGDIILAHGVCAAEAAEKGVSLGAHASHLIVHGLLHLLGYDHQDAAQADAMEALEGEAMAALGLHAPYHRDEP